VEYMGRSIRAVVAIIEGFDRLEVERTFPDHPSFQLVGVTHTLEETLRSLREVDLDVLLVASGGHGERAISVVDAVVRTRPGIPVLVLSVDSPNGFLRRAFEAGAADVIMFPETQEQLRFAMSKALARGTGTDALPRQQAHNELITIVGPKGGAGKTLTATNLSVALARQGHSVALVDLDLQFGDVALTMGIRPDATIYDLSVAGGSLDQDVLSHYLVRHTSGVKALIAPSRPDQASAVTPELIRETYALLRQTNDFVVVDTSPGFTAEVIMSIDASTSLVMVGMLDSLSLKNTKLGLETLKLMGFDPGAIRLVLNRAHSRVGISVTDVIAVLGREPDVYVPSDREISMAVNEGVPIVTAKPDSEASGAFRALAEMVAGTRVPATEARPERRRRRLVFGRRS
jgi:pilus assembly protein CpaE